MNWNKVMVFVVCTVIGIICAAIVTLMSFYFNTTSILAQHSTQINGNTTNVQNLSDTIKNNEQAPIVIQGKIEVIKKDIEHIRENQQRQEVQLSKMLDILIDLKKHNNN